MLTLPGVIAASRRKSWRKSGSGDGGGPVEPEYPVVFCSIPVNYSGGQSFPAEFEVVLGDEEGVVVLHYEAYDVPDKIQVWDGDTKLADSGYVGSPSYQVELNESLASRGLPLETITSGGAGALMFQKTANVSPTVVVRVFAPLPGTAWRVTMNCPEDSPIVFTAGPNRFNSGATGGGINVIFGEGSTVFSYSTAPSYGYFSRSVDDGVTWSSLPFKLNSGSTSSGDMVHKFMSLGDDKYLVLFNGGWASYSDDGGATWSGLPRGLNSGSENNHPLHSLVVGETVIVLFAQGWAARSTDSGATWSALPRGLIPTGGPTGNPDLAVASGSAIVVSYETLGDFRSTDGGATWSQIDLGYGPYDAARYLYPLGGGKWFSYGYSSRGAYSTDDGETWTELTNGLGTEATSSDNARFLNLGNGILLFAFATSVVARSTDYGATWTNLPSILNTGGDYLLDLITLGEGHLFGVANNGYYSRSADYGATWEPMPRWLGTTATSGTVTIVKGEGSVVVATFSDGSAVRSTDYGATWTNLPNSLNTGLTSRRVTLYYLGGGFFLGWAYPSSYLGAYFCISEDNGETWQTLPYWPEFSGFSPLAQAVRQPFSGKVMLWLNGGQTRILRVGGL